MPETIEHLSSTNPEISEFSVEAGWESERTSAIYLRSDQILSGGLRRTLALHDGLGAGSSELIFIDSQSLYLRIERLGWDAELRCCAR
jgi:hypothetical protein